MKKQIILSILISLQIFCIYTVKSNNPGLRVLLTEAAVSNNAVCLDGSPGVYYFRAGSGSGENKW